MASIPLIGRNIGPYKILEKIARGGMGEIYKGFHPDLERYAAIKLIGQALESDPALTKRFKREAKAAAGLDHPNIIQVYDFGVQDNAYYLIMQYVEGTDLRAEMNRRINEGKPFTPEEILHILGQVADALDYAHQRNVVHRDVKPANILLTAEGKAILGDFGLAMFSDPKRTSQLTMGQSFGTPEYIAPEQAIDSSKAVPQSDIYSLGGILYEMVTHKLPFEAESSIGLALKHISEDPTPPSHYAPDLPEAVEAVILRALAKEPADRFATAEEMIEALRGAWLGPPPPPPPSLPPAARRGAAPPPPPDSLERQPTPVPQPPPARAEQPAPAPKPVPTPPPPPVSLEQPPTSAPPPPVSKAEQPAPISRPRPVSRLARPTPPTPAPSPTTSRRGWLFAAGALIILLVGLIGFFALTRPGAPLAGIGAIATETPAPLPARTKPIVLATPTTTPAAVPPTIPAAPLPASPTEQVEASAVSQSPTPKATVAPTATPSPSITPSPSATATPTSTPSPTPTDTATPTSTHTPSPMPMPTLAPGQALTRALDNMVMHFVPGGLFQMGAGEDDPDAAEREKPQHEVQLSPFWIDQTEVTNAQYHKCVDAEVCTAPTNHTAYDDPERANYPVVHVKWEQADAYCRWLADETGWDVHLPTEAQWEKAASWEPLDPFTGTKRLYPWGNEFDSSKCNTKESGIGKATEVGKYPGGDSPYGCADMAGNVWEWVADWFHADYYQTPDSRSDDPLGSEKGTDRITRGGSFGWKTYYARTTHRNPSGGGAGPDVGFRCAVSGERLQ